MNEIVEILQNISPDELCVPGRWVDDYGRMCPVALLGAYKGIDVTDPYMFEFPRKVANAYGVDVMTVHFIGDRYDLGYAPSQIASMLWT